MKKIIFITCILLLLMVLGFLYFDVMGEKVTETEPVGIANPASTFCIQNNGKSEIRTNADMSQTGFCIFTDNSECEEWAFFRKECVPGDIKKI